MFKQITPGAFGEITTKVKARVVARSDAFAMPTHTEIKRMRSAAAYSGNKNALALLGKYVARKASWKETYTALANLPFYSFGYRRGFVQP